MCIYKAIVNILLNNVHFHFMEDYTKDINNCLLSFQYRDEFCMHGPTLLWFPWIECWKAIITECFTTYSPTQCLENHLMCVEWDYACINTHLKARVKGSSYRLMHWWHLSLIALYTLRCYISNVCISKKKYHTDIAALCSTKDNADKLVF